MSYIVYNLSFNNALQTDFFIMLKEVINAHRLLPHKNFMRLKLFQAACQRKLSFWYQNINEAVNLILNAFTSLQVSRKC